MIRTTTDQTATGSRTVAQIFCDGCKASTTAVEIGSASTDRSTALAELRAHTGFVEHGWAPWMGGTAPQGIGDTPIKDFCPRCAAQRDGGTR